MSEGASLKDAVEGKKDEGNKISKISKAGQGGENML